MFMLSFVLAFYLYDPAKHQSSKTGLKKFPNYRLIILPLYDFRGIPHSPPKLQYRGQNAIAFHVFLVQNTLVYPWQYSCNILIINN